MYVMAAASGLEQAIEPNTSSRHRKTSSLNDGAKTKKNNAVVTMEGICLQESERAAIYATLLQSMSDEQRIAVTVSTQIVLHGSSIRQLHATAAHTTQIPLVQHLVNADFFIVSVKRLVCTSACFWSDTFSLTPVYSCEVC